MSLKQETGSLKQKTVSKTGSRVSSTQKIGSLKQETGSLKLWSGMSDIQRYPFKPLNDKKWLRYPYLITEKFIISNSWFFSKMTFLPPWENEEKLLRIWHFSTHDMKRRYYSLLLRYRFKGTRLSTFLWLINGIYVYSSFN